MYALRRTFILTLALVLGASPAILSAQETQDPCVCPVRGDRGGVAGLLGLAALGLARVGTGVRSFAAEPTQAPVLATVPMEEAAPPVAAAPPVVPDTARDTTETAAPAPAMATTPPSDVAMAAPPADAPLGVMAPRTATQMPMLALLGLSALLGGLALLFLRKRQAQAAVTTTPRHRYSPYTVVLLGGRAVQPTRRRIR